MEYDEFYGYATYIIQFILPVAMIFLYDIKYKKLNKLYSFSYILGMLIFSSYLIVATIFKLDNIIFNMYVRYPNTLLMTLYGVVGLTFAYHLIQNKDWDFPQAFAISVICACIGTFFWEIPTVIVNLFTVGFEIDIFLYVMFFMLILFVQMKGGWNLDKKSVLMVLFGLFISSVFVYFRQPIPVNDLYKTPYWNSSYYMTNRFISTLIVLYCVNKNKPMEKSKVK